MSEGQVHTVYCEATGQIVPLDDRFCRACSTQLDELDGAHREVTPEVLKGAGHVTTPLPEKRLRREG